MGNVVVIILSIAVFLTASILVGLGLNRLYKWSFERNRLK